MRLTRPLESFRHITEILRFAVAGEHPRSVEIAATLLSFRVRQLLSMAIGHQAHSARILGTLMHFSHPSNFYFLGREIFVDGAYKGACTTPRRILDCGSNIGMSILYFKSLWPEAEITGVEAAPDTFAVLQQNVAALPGVTVLNRAVCDRPGTMSFYSNTAHSETASLIAARGGGRETVVEATPLSELITGPIDLLKIDIEGAENAAFAELEASGKFQLIGEMFIEYHHHLPGEENGLAAFLARLTRCGFDFVVRADTPENFEGFQDVSIWAKRIHLQQAAHAA
jgi:FkbM family methyltransferase